ncbi:serine threonine protein kinase [Stylonychia lemnae]|uniref:Serine threonine protein kinase n=1 Tax=Stylonychia lemnae TaxID=5949 RepID=A0A078B646_STYLE|nr:serine threonine protein kinase [Stylonychia lemnae]|eukprot:CDW88988.1 serine threonine protein kinase [Stylonychia lemnae]
MENLISLKIKDTVLLYDSLTKLDGGAFGESQYVALKVQHLKKLRECNDQQISAELLRLFREISCNQLHHPNIVKTFDSYFTYDGGFVMTSELAQENLQSYVIRKGKGNITLEEVAQIMSDVINALEYIHNYNIIHRDISPQNILVYDEKTFKICDFGIATYGELTQIAGGKIDYIAPEIHQMTGEYDKMIDIWSLGVLLHFICTGESTFNGKPACIAKKEINQLLLPPQITIKTQNNATKRIFPKFN